MRRRAVSFGVVAVATALVAGFVFAQSAPAKPKYVLEWKTEIKYGIRAYPETVYTYFEVQPDGTRKELWRAKEGDKPARHWISSVGNVYVLTDPMAGPGQASRIWLRNKAGVHQGTFSSNRLAQPRPRNGRLTYGPSAPFEADRVVLRELRKGEAEELLLPVKDWGTGRLIVMWPNPKEKPQAYAYWLATSKTPDPILEDVLEDPAYKIPTHELPFGSDYGVAVWTAEGVDPNTKPRYWIQSGSYWYPSDAGQTRSQMAEVRSEEATAALPELKRLPHWKLAWTEIDRTAKPATAKLKVITRGNFSTSVDLLKLGGFTSVKEVETKLLDNGINVLTGPKGWVQMGTWPVEAYGPAVLLEMWDDAKRRFLVSVGTEGKIETRVYSGVEARRTKESEDPFVKLNPQSETFYKSPNGKFVLRHRLWPMKHDPQYYPTIGRFTMLARVPNDKGKLVDVELWTKINYGKIAAVKVSDSGNALVVDVGWANHGTKERDMRRNVSAWVYMTDGTYHGIDHQAWGLAKPDDVQTGVKTKEIKFTPIGQNVADIVDGLELRAWQCEKLEIPLAKGTKQTYFVFMHPLSMGGRVHTDQPWVRQYIGIDKQ